MSPLFSKSFNKKPLTYPVFKSVSHREMGAQTKMGDKAAGAVIPYANAGDYCGIRNGSFENIIPHFDREAHTAHVIGIAQPGADPESIKAARGFKKFILIIDLVIFV